MEYEIDIVINKPREEVIKLFDNPDNMPKWQPGFISFEHVSGKPGEEGAKSRLKYKMGKRDLEMIETIIKRDLPHEFSGTYEAQGVKNWVYNYFEVVDEQHTRWRSRNIFKFSGWMKLMGWFMPGAFRKQSAKYQDLFKEFAEKED